MTNNKIYRGFRHSLVEYGCDGGTYTCSGCKTMGIGPRFKCSGQGCNDILHIECERAGPEIKIEGQTCVFYEIPPRGKDCTLPRKKKFCTDCRSCSVCKKAVKGFAYHCSKTDWVFHPGCAKISINGDTLSLKKDGPSECELCDLRKKQQLKGDEKKSPAIEKEKKSSGDEKKSSVIKKEKKSSGAIEKEKENSGDKKKSPAINEEKKSCGDEKKSSAIKKEKKHSGDEKKSPAIKEEKKSCGDEKKSSAIKKEKKSSGDEKKSPAIEKEKKSSGDEKKSCAIKKEKRSSGDEKKISAIKKEKKSTGDEKKSPAIENEKESSGWSYVSDENGYSLHVDCVRKWCWLISESNEGDPFLTIVERMELHLKNESKNGGSKSSNKWLKMFKILLKTVISIFLGDPTTLIVTAIDLLS